MRRVTVTRRYALAISAIALAATALSSGAQQEAPSGGPLAELWTTRGALEDTNGDGFADSTRLNIELLDAADEAQLAAAANVAARLGFETMSIDLPLAASPEGPTVIIGRASPAAQGLAGVDAEPRGYVFVGDDAATIHVWGDDEAALAAATLWLTGRAPNVWDDDALTLGASSALILNWAQDNDLPVSDVVPAGVALRAGEPGLETLFVDIAVATEAADLSAAIAALADGPEIDGVANVAVRVLASGSAEFVHITSPGTAAEAGGAPGGDGRKKFDLGFSTGSTQSSPALPSRGRRWGTSPLVSASRRPVSACQPRCHQLPWGMHPEARGSSSAPIIQR